MNEDPFERLKRYGPPQYPSPQEWAAAYATVEAQARLASARKLPLPDVWNPAVINMADGSYVTSGLYDPILKAAGKKLVQKHVPAVGYETTFHIRPGQDPRKTATASPTKWVWSIEDWDSVFVPVQVWESAVQQRLPLIAIPRSQAVGKGRGFFWTMPADDLEQSEKQGHITREDLRRGLADRMWPFPLIDQRFPPAAPASAPPPPGGEPAEVAIPFGPDEMRVVRQAKGIRVRELPGFQYEVSLVTVETAAGWSEVVFMVRQAPPDRPPLLIQRPRLVHHPGGKYR